MGVVRLATLSWCDVDTKLNNFDHKNPRYQYEPTIYRSKMPVDVMVS